MKNKILIVILSSLIILSTGCFNKKDSVKTDAIKFKEEYEKLNDTESNYGIKYSSLEISKKNPIKYATETEIIDVIKNKTGVIYLGYPECPWCRTAVPVLLEAAKQTGIDKVYYLNMKDVRDKKKLDENGKVVIEEQGSKDYPKLLEALGEYADVYDGLNDDSIKRIYVPIVIFVKDGKIIGKHLDTVSSQENPFVKLDEEQTKELLNIYKDYMHKMLDDLCDSSC